MNIIRFQTHLNKLLSQPFHRFTWVSKTGTKKIKVYNNGQKYNRKGSNDLLVHQAQRYLSISSSEEMKKHLNPEHSNPQRQHQQPLSIMSLQMVLVHLLSQTLRQQRQGRTCTPYLQNEKPLIIKAKKEKKEITEDKYQKVLPILTQNGSIELPTIKITAFQQQTIPTFPNPKLYG